MPELPALSHSALYSAFELADIERHGKACARLVRQGYDIAGAIRSHVLGDDWFDFALESLRAHFRSAKGHVYLVSGPAHAGLVKLGKTAHYPEERLKSLNNASVLLPLQLLEAFAVHDRHWVEAECHRQLDKAGVRRAKEFFDAAQSELAELVRAEVVRDQSRFERQGLSGALA